MPTLHASTSPLRLRLALAVTVIVTLVAASVGVVWFSLISVKQSQDIRQQAAVGDVVKVSFRADRTTLNPGQSAHLDVMVNTQGKQISAFDIHGAVTNIAVDKLAISDAQDGLDLVHSSVGSDSQITWQLTHFINPGGSNYFVSTQDMKIATLTITPDQTGSITVSFNASESDVAGPTDPIVGFSSAVTLTVQAAIGGTGDDKKSCDQNCATDTECKSEFICYKGRCRNPDDRENAACGQPDMGLNRQCNEYCADTRECATGFTCYYNRCRNPRNIEETACKDPVKVRVSTISAGLSRGNASKGASGKGGTTAPPKVSIVDISTKQATPAASQSPSPSPSPTQQPSPVPTPTPRVSPSPSPTIQPEQPKRGLNVVSILLIVAVIFGAIGAAIWFIRQRQG